MAFSCEMTFFIVVAGQGLRKAASLSFLSWSLSIRLTSLGRNSASRPATASFFLRRPVGALQGVADEVAGTVVDLAVECFLVLAKLAGARLAKGAEFFDAALVRRHCRQSVASSGPNCGWSSSASSCGR